CRARAPGAVLCRRRACGRAVPSGKHVGLGCVVAVSDTCHQHCAEQALPEPAGCPARHPRRCPGPSAHIQALTDGWRRRRRRGRTRHGCARTRSGRSGLAGGRVPRLV
ncbi:hypothetical protein IWQ57_003802, partial [Coemansia nantahalensis]